MSIVRGFYKSIPGNADYSQVGAYDDNDTYLKKEDSPSLQSSGGLIHLGEGIVVTNNGEIEVDIERVRTLLGNVPTGVDIQALAQQLLNSGELEPDLQALANELIQSGQITSDAATVANQLIASGTLSPYVTTLVQQILDTGGFAVDLDALKQQILSDPNFTVDAGPIEQAAVDAALLAVTQALADSSTTFITDYGTF